MTTTFRRFGKLAAVLAPLALVGACSSLDSDDKVLLQKAVSNSEAAMAEARRASENSAQALAAARQAQATSQQALTEVQTVRTEVRTVTERFDRAYRRGMAK
ncbi:MAG: hypothetical protein AB7O45_03065 [Alphaproteobacteria bacterium]